MAPSYQTEPLYPGEISAGNGPAFYEYLIILMKQTNQRGVASNGKPRATVHQAGGEVVGAALFLGSEELRELGVAGADRVRYHIENGEVQVLVEDE
ncbi:hypothetical protein [Haloglomus salinum]|uniref:hypothetical protein n=1 Tax=Haloglomus salinum TaxID=2962673 RepID=UPI0020C94E21|nr:hypothetical protein [Haloglomus salinum]